ncbi:hypothetical protein P171DRAFT_105755 [Karstenula rhodostoma CBS 690.94]|uniref:Uncharacterized protein n=1 Tax=Karstenula rhodostoma CBS 690.94 TaxID=1392251 RepID=A0A9P4PBA5_9PLEO|nr:hypothetical protein P171DRAFT_105755 [Karstenula rhodostoma CBS 690.94]
MRRGPSSRLPLHLVHYPLIVTLPLHIYDHPVPLHILMTAPSEDGFVWRLTGHAVMTRRRRSPSARPRGCLVLHLARLSVANAFGHALHPGTPAQQAATNQLFPKIWWAPTQLRLQAAPTFSPTCTTNMDTRNPTHCHRSAARSARSNVALVSPFLATRTFT